MASLFGFGSKATSTTTALPAAYTAAAKVAQWRATRQADLKKWLDTDVKRYVLTSIAKKASVGETQFVLNSKHLAENVPLPSTAVSTGSNASIAGPIMSEWIGNIDGAWMKPSLLSQLTQWLDGEKFTHVYHDDGKAPTFFELTITWPDQPPASAVPVAIPDAAVSTNAEPTVAASEPAVAPATEPVA